MRILFFDPETTRATAESERFFRGSNIAFRSLSAALADLGHQVSVLYAENSPPDEHFDLAIVQRQPRWAKKLSAGLKLIWSHDPLRWRTPEEAREFVSLLKSDDSVRIMVLSRYHRATWRELDLIFGDRAFLQCGHGVRPELAPSAPPRERRRRFVYASAPHRGLGYLLEMWPALSARLPEYELHVTAGNEFYRDKSQHLENGETQAIIRRCRELPGVTLGAGGSAAELYQLLAESEALLYPSVGQELFCITAHEAMFNGCVPIVSEAWALPEVVSHGATGIVVEGHPPVYRHRDLRGADAFCARYVDTVVAAIEEGALEPIRKSLLANPPASWHCQAKALLRKAGEIMKQGAVDSIHNKDT